MILKVSSLFTSFNRTAAVSAVLALSLSSVSLAESMTKAEATNKAGKLYKNLNNGIPLLPSNPLYQQIIDAVQLGQSQAAAQLITDPTSGSATFYNNAIAALGQTVNRDGSAVGSRNEISAMMLGYARDGIRFSEMFYTDRVYNDPTQVANGTVYATAPAGHYNAIWLNKNPRDVLVAGSRPTSPAVGIFTTAQWGSSYFDGGTNRRNFGIGIMQDLYCTNQDAIRTLVIPDTYVGRDVPRNPGNDPSQFLKNCKSCHAQMDAIRPAFLAYDWNGTNVVKAAVKEKIAEMNYPEGIQPTSEDWHLYVTPDQNRIFGFNEVEGMSFQNYGPDVKVMNGQGLAQFGQVIGNSTGLYRCMIRRIVSQVYLGKVFSLTTLSEPEVALLNTQNAVIDEIAASFQKHQSLRRAYEEVALYYLDAIQE